MKKKIQRKPERSCRVHYPVRRNQPLYTQFRAQRRSLGFTNQEIADEVGVARTTVARELGIEPPKPMSLPLAQRLGNVLGFDPAYVALVHARDSVFAHTRSDKYDEQAQQQLKHISLQLDRYVRRQHPFRVEDAGLRLAFRAERCRRRVSPEYIARHARCADRVSPRLIQRYETALSSLNEDSIEKLVAALSAVSPHLAPVTLSTLDRESKKLAVAHRVEDTIEWQSYKDITICGHQFHCPYETGYDIAVGLSPTLWSSMGVKLIRVTQPRKVSRSRVRVIGLQPKGIQIGMVTQGDVKLALSSRPFPSEETERCYDYTMGQPDIVCARTCKSGDVLITPGRHFYRMEFLGRTCLLAIVNLKENLLLPEPL